MRAVSCRQRNARVGGAASGLRKLRLGREEQRDVIDAAPRRRRPEGCAVERCVTTILARREPGLRSERPMTDFRHNHYVPRWYQERFLAGGVKQRELYYLNKEPQTVRDGRGRRITLPAVEPRALKNCFARRDLYTLTFRGIPSTELERKFLRTD